MLGGGLRLTFGGSVALGTWRGVKWSCRDGEEVGGWQPSWPAARCSCPELDVRQEQLN